MRKRRGTTSAVDARCMEHVSAQTWSVTAPDAEHALVASGALLRELQGQRDGVEPVVIALCLDYLDDGQVALVVTVE